MKRRSDAIALAFGRTLRQIRTAKKLSQESLAFDAELDRTYISLLELGQRTPSLDTMLSLAQALGVSFAHLAESVQASLTELDSCHGRHTSSPDTSS